ncbi:hypothetical protein [Pseudomonas sp. KNUC1026]|uniref:hypothetical protein n=1 Tax=Pseudomonas sp. KNUC1026 TaxID=2893890 RepID=UPI001F3C1B6D|nr:hypothetical protein [Pseudomonas sp. KNUC1026]UFH49935.1 hypothetical protein LN139_00655 [Pseudomonas sp. KNUC1026]
MLRDPGVLLMTKYARIDQGVVMELFETEADIATLFHPDLVWVRCDGQQDVAEGWTYTSETFAPARVIDPATSVPELVSMMQLRLAMLNAGLLDRAQAAVDGMTGEAGRTTQIQWQYAQQVRRDWPLLASLQKALKLNDKALDNLFIAAAAIR